MSTALALRPRLVELRRICCRCRGPYEDDHICHDRVRHPAAERFLLALASLGDRPRTASHDVLSVWIESGGDTPLGDLAHTPEDVELCVEAFAVAFQWANLPRNEQRVANAILEHAGYPTLEVA